MPDLCTATNIEGTFPKFHGESKKKHWSAARATNLILQNFHPSFFGFMGFTGMLLPKQAVFEIDSFIRTRQKDIPRCLQNV